MKQSSLHKLPFVLQDSNSWLVANRDKIPVRPSSNDRITGDKQTHTLPLRDVINLIERDQHDYAVYYHSDNTPIVSIDIDHCQDPDTHKLCDWCAQMIWENDIGYMESSSSNTGLRICCLAKIKDFNKRVYYINPQYHDQSAPKGAEKIEIMARQALAVYTGEVHPLCNDPDRMTALAPLLKWLDKNYPIPSKEWNHPPNTHSVLRNYPGTKRTQIIEALECIPPDLNHDDWKQIGMALKNWSPVEGEELWINWSQNSDQFKNANECRIAWRSFDKTKSGISIATLFHHAKNYGYQPKKKQNDLDNDLKNEPNQEEHTMISNETEIMLTENTPDNEPPIAMVSGNGVMDMPVIPYLVDHLLPETGFVQLFGNSGTFKSFLAIDLSMAIVSGTPWLGKEVRKGSVVYLCGEGIFGMGARLRAWKTKNIEADMNKLMMSVYIPDLTNFDVLGRLTNYLKATPELRLVVIDTFARAMIHIGNESDNADIGKYNRIIDYLRNQTKCLILQVHHTGHTNKERSRGASGLYAALDAEYQCVRLGEKDGYLKCTKAKDFPEPEVVNFTMKPVTVDNSSSLIVTERTKPIPTKRQEVMEAARSESLTGKQLNIVGTYELMYALYESNANANDNVTPRVLLTEFKDQLVTSGNCVKAHVTRDVKVLIKKNVFVMEGMYIKMM